MDEVQSAIKQTILLALDETSSYAEVEIHYLVQQDGGYEVRGTYEISRFLSTVAEGNYKIVINENLEILEMELT